MKKRVIVVSTILLISIMIAGGSLAWFTSNSGEAVNQFQAGTVKVKVIEEGFEDLENVEATTYNKNVRVKSLGTKKTYVRVRLVPEWSDPSLPVSNVELNLAENSDWIHHTDGYYYFKHYLTENQITGLLLDSVTFTTLGQEYEGATFTLKVVSEGVQITHEAWEHVWGLTSLPFDPAQPWIP